MSQEAVKLFIEKMKQDEIFADKIVTGSNKDERLALAKAAGFDFTAEEFNYMVDKGEINIDQMLSYMAKTYESRGIRLFVRSGTGLFE